MNVLRLIHQSYHSCPMDRFDESFHWCPGPTNQTICVPWTEPACSYQFPPLLRHEIHESYRWSRFDSIGQPSIESKNCGEKCLTAYQGSPLKHDLPVWPDLEQMGGCSFHYLFRKSDYLQRRLDEWKEELGFNLTLF